MMIRYMIYYNLLSLIFYLYPYLYDFDDVMVYIGLLLDWITDSEIYKYQLHHNMEKGM